MDFRERTKVIEGICKRVRRAVCEGRNKKYVYDATAKEVMPHVERFTAGSGISPDFVLRVLNLQKSKNNSKYVRL